MKRLLNSILILILPVITVFGQAHINLQNGYVVNNGAVVVVQNSNPNAIVPINGWIITANESSYVEWNIGANTGTYVVPFGDSTLKYLPLTLDINAAGTGAGNIKFSTYHTPALNSLAKPSDVTNVTPFILPGSPSNADNSYNVADRFYIVDANTGYSAKPGIGNLTLSYVSGTPQTEVGLPNTLTESRLMAQRFNSVSNTWTDWFGEGCTDAVVNNVGTVQTGAVAPGDFYRSWSLWDNLTPLPVEISGTNPTCNGIGGTATVNVFGGVTPYTYSWSPSGGSLATANGLSGGTYTVSVNDVNGCTSTISITLTQPSALTLAPVVISNIPCFGGTTGNAAANASGGSSPYTYNWSNGSSTVCISDPTGPILTAGGYTVSVQDNAGCAATASVTITQPGQFIFVSAGRISNVTCFGASNGGATATPVGGSSPFTYAWNNASTTVSTTQTATGLSGGTYTVTVMDNCGVTKTATATITEPAPLRDSISALGYITCNGGNGGWTSVGVRGGTYPYIYSWAPGGSTLATISNLTAGSYTVTVTDQNGCSTTNANQVATITQPAVIRDSVVSINYPLCYGQKGNVTVGVKGGVTPYAYSWTSSLSTTSTATSVGAGTYTVTIKDAHRCGAQLVFTMTQPGAIRDSVVAATKVNVSCNGGSNGSATVGVKYGTSPYTYNWTPNVSSTATASGLSAGIYSVTVTDKNNCLSSTAIVSISQPVVLQDSVSVLGNVGCFGGSGGQISVGTRGGTIPYTYAWSNGKTTYTMSGLSAGTYTITLSDKHGCSNTLSVTLTQPTQIISTFTDSCIGNSKATVKVIVTGGVAPYSYRWSNAKTTSSITAANGTYTITVKDAHGCSETNSVTFNCPPVALSKEEPQDNPPGCCPTLKDINLYPNPNLGQFTVEITGYQAGVTNVNAEIYNMSGEKIYSQFNIQSSTFNFNITDQPNGIYFIRIIDKDGTLVGQKKVVKTQ